jgi:hypothetical protein
MPGVDAALAGEIFESSGVLPEKLGLLGEVQERADAGVEKLRQLLARGVRVGRARVFTGEERAGTSQ